MKINREFLGSITAVWLIPALIAGTAAPGFELRSVHGARDKLAPELNVGQSYFHGLLGAFSQGPVRAAGQTSTGKVLPDAQRTGVLNLSGLNPRTARQELKEIGLDDDFVFLDAEEVFMELTKPLLGEKAPSYYPAWQSLLNAHRKHKSWFLKPFAMAVRLGKMAQSYREYKKTGSMAAAFDMFRGLTPQDINKAAAKVRLKKETLEVLEMIKAARGHKSINVVIVSKSMEELISAFLERPEVKAELEKRDIHICAIIANKSEYDAQGSAAGLKKDAAHVTAENKTAYIPRNNVYIADRHERHLARRRNVLFVEDFGGPGFDLRLEKFATGYLTLDGSDGTFYVRDDKTKALFDDIADGEIVTINAFGGGYDIIGTIFSALRLKEKYRKQGKNVRLRIITSSVKYGIENPSCGPLAPEHMSGLERIKIKGVKNSAFYRAAGEIKTKIIRRDKQEQEIIIGGKPYVHEARWFESDILELLREDGIEWIIADFSSRCTEKELNRQYKLLTGKGLKLDGDWGGDVLARPPGVIAAEEDLETHLISPVSDFFGANVSNARRMWVEALGGDSELSMNEQIIYMLEHARAGRISGVFDNLEFVKNNPAVLERMKKYDEKLKRGEVSKNFIRLLNAASVSGETGSARIYGPWNFKELMKRDESIELSRVRRGELTRPKQYLSNAYFLSILLNKTAVLKKISAPKIRDRKKTWKELKDWFEAKCIGTEQLPHVVYAYEVKYYAETLSKMMESGCSAEDMLAFAKRTDIYITDKLAALKALVLSFSSDAAASEEERILAQEVVRELLTVMNDRTQDIFLLKEVIDIMDMFMRNTQAYPEEIAAILVKFLLNQRAFGAWRDYAPYYDAIAGRKLTEKAKQTMKSVLTGLVKNGQVEQAKLYYKHLSQVSEKLREFFKDIFVLEDASCSLTKLELIVLTAQSIEQAV